MPGYVLSLKAQRDLDEIWDYTFAEWGIAQAERYITDIQRTIQLLADMPGLGRVIDGVRQGYFKFPVGSHILIYRKLKSKIDIVRILHGRMDIDRHL